MPNPLLAVLVGSLEQAAAQALAAELHAGSPLNQAIDTVLTRLEALIPIPEVRTQADAFLRNLIVAGETIAAAAIGHATPAP